MSTLPDPPQYPSMSSELEQLLAKCIEIAERDGDGAVDAFLEQHVDHASQLREILGRLRGIGMVGGEGK